MSADKTKTNADILQTKYRQNNAALAPSLTLTPAVKIAVALARLDLCLGLPKNRHKKTTRPHRA